MDDLDYLYYATVREVIKDVDPYNPTGISCTKEISKQLKTLDEDEWISCYGNYRFRLSDDEPSYYIKKIVLSE